MIVSCRYCVEQALKDNTNFWFTTTFETYGEAKLMFAKLKMRFGRSRNIRIAKITEYHEIVESSVEDISEIEEERIITI